MDTMIKTLKKIAKLFVDYQIVGEYKVYRLKHTPFSIRKKYTNYYHRYLEPLPIDKRKVVFDNYMGAGYGCNGKYVLEELLRRNASLDLVWTVKGARMREGEFPPQVRLVEYGSKEAMKEYATAGAWVQNYHLVHYLNQGLQKKEGQTYIQMWHGSFGIKKIESDCDLLQKDKNWVTLARKNSTDTDYWISNSAFETEVYHRAFWDVKHVLEYGHPRNDIFFSPDLEQIRTKVKERLGAREERLLLYAPTFRDDDMQMHRGNALDVPLLLQSMAERFGGTWKLLWRAHPRLSNPAPPSLGETGSADVLDVTAYPDIQELLATADAMVTDYSSAVFDYLLTGRPAFLYASDIGDYEQLRGFYYPLEETPFPISKDMRQLRDQILDFDLEWYHRRVQEFLEDKGSKENGHAAEAVADLLQSCCKY